MAMARTKIESRTYRDLVRTSATIVEAVYAPSAEALGATKSSSGLKEFLARFDAALDGAGVIAELLEKPC